MLLISFLQGILWALIIPPWQAPDEPAHFAYIQHLSEKDTWLPPGRKTRISSELQKSLDELKTDGIRHNNNSVFSFTDGEAESAKRQLDSMTLEDRDQSGKTKNRAGHYPPLYYKLGTAGYLAFYNGSITTRLFGTRMVSIVITSLTVLAMFMASRHFFEGDTLCSRTAASLLLFHPMFAFIGSSVILDTLLVLVSTVMIWLSLLMIRGGPTWKLQAGLCACMVLGLLTKPTFIAMTPLWLLALAIFCLRDGPGKRKNLMHVLFALLILCAGGILYFDIGDSYLRLWMRSVQAGQEDGSQSFFSYLAISFFNLVRPWSLMAKRFLTSYWANFGWMDTNFPFFIYLIGFIVLAAAGISVIVKIWKGPQRWYSGRNGLVSYGFFGSIIFFAGVVIMGYTIAHQAWGTGNIQGRYFFPTIGLHMMILTAGLLYFFKSQVNRKRMAFLMVGAMLLFQLASFALVFERYYL